jgi:ribonuclease BN (tRNA processing enzyme)
MGMIQITILGAGGAIPTPTHTPAAYWVTVDGTGLLMDPGPGALVRLVKSGAGPVGVDDIDRVLLTHLHPDHSLDLVALLFALHSPVLESTAPLHLCGPHGLQELLEKLRGIYGSWLEPRNRELVVEEIGPEQKLASPPWPEVRSFAANHPKDRLSRQALGYRFTDREGRVAVFSGDTGPSPALEEAARGADLLVVECSTPDHLAIAGHLSPAQVAALCAVARPGHTILTHQYPAAAELDLAALVGENYQGSVEQARDGLRVTVPSPEK